MQNNVTELTNRLLGALDKNYNVIDMQAVIEIFSLLEKVTITKELLETTRLGKHVNELRRKTNNDSLSKRAKELVKKWRNMVLPEPSSNGQLLLKTNDEPIISKKRTIQAKSPPTLDKRPKLNGDTLDLVSDNSNSSFKDNVIANAALKQHKDVITINSDSNSSFPDNKIEQNIDALQQQPKKRGRKKGSKNHKNLLDEAETSFTNKLAVSRGNSKVKTTQELIASLQNKNSSVQTSPGKSKEDLSLRAAKLTERVSIIDQKLNTNANRYKNSQKHRNQAKIHLGLEKSDRIIESGSVINDKSLREQEKLREERENDEIIVVDEDVEPKSPEFVAASVEEANKALSLSVEEARALLPPLSELLDEKGGLCSCLLREIDAEEMEAKRYEFVEDGKCEAALEKPEKSAQELIGAAHELHSTFWDNVNGNWGVGEEVGAKEVVQDGGLYVNVVPNVNSERIVKDVKDLACDENYKKYNISDSDERRTMMMVDGDERGVFSEWHQVLGKPSYNGEILKILPYVIID